MGQSQSGRTYLLVPHTFLPKGHSDFKLLWPLALPSATHNLSILLLHTLEPLTGHSIFMTFFAGQDGVLSLISPSGAHTKLWPRISCLRGI